MNIPDWVIDVAATGHIKVTGTHRCVYVLDEVGREYTFTTDDIPHLCREILALRTARREDDGANAATYALVREICGCSADEPIDAPTFLNEAWQKLKDENQRLRERVERAEKYSISHESWADYASKLKSRAEAAETALLTTEERVKDALARHFNDELNSGNIASRQHECTEICKIVLPAIRAGLKPAPGGEDGS